MREELVAHHDLPQPRVFQLAQCLLVPADIAEVRQVTGPAQPLDRRHMHLGRERAAVATGQLHLAAAAVDRQAQRAADQGGAGPAEQRLGGRVGEDDGAGQAGDDDAVGRGGDQTSQAVLAGGDLALADGEFAPQVVPLDGEEQGAPQARRIETVLGQEILGAGPHRRHTNRLVQYVRQDQDGSHALGGQQARQAVQAVRVGQTQVQHDRVEEGSRHRGESLGDRTGFAHAVAVGSGLAQRNFRQDAAGQRNKRIGAPVAVAAAPIA